MTSNSSSPKPELPNDKKRIGISAYEKSITFIFKILMILAVLIVICFIVFYVIIGTASGTRFFVEKIVRETGIDIVYGEGNLRDGLLVKDVALSASDDIEVHIIDAYIQLGWRALFNKEIHLSNATIGRIEVINDKPPTGNPFDYKALQLPVNLRFDAVKINAIEYDQAGREPILVTDVIASDLNWIDTTVNTRNTSLQYNEIFHIADLDGFIELQGDYPLDAKATVTVNALDKVYFDPLQVSAKGSLKLTTGTIISRYNDQKISGEFAVQGLEPDAPFDVTVVWDEVVLPYVESQAITLQEGSLVASGVLSQINLQVDTLLHSKDIPLGHYQGEATVADSQMQITDLTAVTEQGQLDAKGQLDWRNNFKLNTNIKGETFKIRELLPEEYQAYAPQTLNGTLKIKYEHNPDALTENTVNTAQTSDNESDNVTAASSNSSTERDSQQRIIVELNQKDGEHIHATIDKGVTPKTPRFSAPWFVDATWENVKRQDIPKIGDIDSPYGKADVQIRDDKLWVDANARINKLNVAPMGNYDVSISKYNNKVGIRSLNYDGAIGDLTGTGEINLATQAKPLTWKIDAQTTGLNPSAYNTSLPINQLVGSIKGSGRMLDINKKVGAQRVAGQRHEFDITATDLKAVISNDTNTANNLNNSNNTQPESQSESQSDQSRVVHIQGKADGSVDLLQGDIDKFNVKFNGNLDAENIGTSVPQGNLVVDVYGTPQNITLNTLKHTGEAGAIDAKGKLNLTDGIAWDITAKADDFNFGFFTPKVEGMVTGNLITSGKWHSNDQGVGELQAFDIDFDGSLDTPELPKGTLKIDASIDANNSSQAVNIRKFEHSGEAGDISAKGKVLVKNGIQWDITAKTQEFDVGFFAPQTQGIVTGDLVTSGKWQPNDSGSSNSKNNASDNVLEGIEAFAIDFDGSLDTPQLPKGQLKINADSTPQGIRIREFSHVGDAGRINAKGTVNIDNGIDWQINAVMNDFNASYFLENVPSNITGHINTTGSWQDDTQRINIEEMVLKGQLKGEPLTAQGSLTSTLHLPTDMAEYFDTLQQAENQNANARASKLQALVETLNADDLALLWGDNQIVVNGDEKRLQANVNMVDLTSLSANLNGSVVGGLTLVQLENSSLPTIYVDLTAKRITLPSFAIESGVIKGKVADLGSSPSTLAMTAKNLRAADRDFDSLTALFTGTEAEHVLSAKISNSQATIDTLLKGGLSRTNGKVRWSGVMGDGKVSSKYMSLVQRQPAQLIVDIEDSNAPNNGFGIQVAAHCWVTTNESNNNGSNSNDGKLCLRDNLIVTATQGQVDLAIQQIDTRLISPFLPRDISWQAKVNGKAVIGWQQGQNPNINATLYSDNGRIGMTQEGNAPDVTLPYKRISLIALSVPNGLKLRTDIDNGNDSKAYADVVVDPYSENKAMRGEVALDGINVALFKPFFPGMRTLEGQLTMAGQVDGTLSQPKFNGEVELSDARIATLDLPINLSNINVISHIQGQNATIEGRFNSGEGTGTLTGSVNWQQDLQAKLSIEGQRLIITQPPALFAEISPDIDIIVRPNDKYVDIQGSVLVPTATIRPPEANEEEIVESEDVVVLDRRLIGNIDDVLAISKPWSINADIGIDLGSDVNFRGFGAVLPLAGALNVTQKGQSEMKALGVIQVARRSDVDVFGQNLELNYGQIRFNGNVLNPNLSIEAVKEIENQTVGVRVTGSTSEPNITVFNDAGLTEQQAMNALVTGRISNSGATQISAEGFKSRVTNNLAAAGLSIGLSGTRSLTNSIGQAFGLQRLTVDASGNADDTNVNVTGYITPDLYIRYGVGVFNAETTLSMRYQLTRRIYIEATSATENAVDVVYSWEF